MSLKRKIRDNEKRESEQGRKRFLAIARKWRRFMVTMLKTLSPEDYNEYNRLRIHEGMLKADKFAAQRFLELTFTCAAYD